MSDLERIRLSLQEAGFLPVQVLTIGGTAWRAPGGELVDVIESDAPWVGEALQNLQRDAQGFPVLSLPYLVLMKVEASRVQDLADAARMLGLADETTRQAVRVVFNRWLPDALEDLDSLMMLGILEMGG